MFRRLSGVVTLALCAALVPASAPSIARAKGARPLEPSAARPAAKSTKSSKNAKPAAAAPVRTGLENL
jgi:hypothetical protein